MKSYNTNINLKNNITLRIAFGIAGTLLCISLFGYYFIHEKMIFLSYLVGGGLLFTSITGWCPMAHIIDTVASFVKRK